MRTIEYQLALRALSKERKRLLKRIKSQPDVIKSWYDEDVVEWWYAQEVSKLAARWQRNKE